MKSKANITPPVANAGRLQKFDLATLQFACETLAAEAKVAAPTSKSVDEAVVAVLQLRQHIAIKKVGGLEKFATVQSLAEALLQVEVCDGVGLPYDEVLFIVKRKFSDADTSMDSIRWYASKMQNREENPAQLPPRPASTSVASA